MGIHYDYKNTRGDKKLRKQQEREERRSAKKKKNQFPLLSLMYVVKKII